MIVDITLNITSSFDFILSAAILICRFSTKKSGVIVSLLKNDPIYTLQKQHTSSLVINKYEHENILMKKTNIFMSKKRYSNLIRIIDFLYYLHNVPGLRKILPFLININTNVTYVEDLNAFKNYIDSAYLLPFKAKGFILNQIYVELIKPCNWLNENKEFINCSPVWFCLNKTNALDGFNEEDFLHLANEYDQCYSKSDYDAFQSRNISLCNNKILAIINLYGIMSIIIKKQEEKYDKFFSAIIPLLYKVHDLNTEEIGYLSGEKAEERPYILFLKLSIEYQDYDKFNAIFTNLLPEPYKTKFYNSFKNFYSWFYLACILNFDSIRLNWTFTTKDEASNLILKTDYEWRTHPCITKFIAIIKNKSILPEVSLEDIKELDQIRIFCEMAFVTRIHFFLKKNTTQFQFMCFHYRTKIIKSKKKALFAAVPMSISVPAPISAPEIIKNDAIITPNPTSIIKEIETPNLMGITNITKLAKRKKKLGNKKRLLPMASEDLLAILCKYPNNFEAYKLAYERLEELEIKHKYPKPIRPLMTKEIFQSKNKVPPMGSKNYDLYIPKLEFHLEHEKFLNDYVAPIEKEPVKIKRSRSSSKKELSLREKNHSITD